MEQLGFQQKDDWNWERIIGGMPAAADFECIIKDDRLTSMFDDVYNVFLMFMILNVYNVWKLFPFSHSFYFNSTPKKHTYKKTHVSQKNVPPMLTLSFPVPF